MGTKQYKVKVEQFIEVEVEEKTKNKDITLIKREIKLDPPYVEIYGSDIRFKTIGKIKIKNIRKVAEYKECPKCKGSGMVSFKRDMCYHNEYEVEECYRCKGRGEVLKKKRKIK